MKKLIFTGRDFGLAVTEHLALDPSKVSSIALVGELRQTFGVEVKINLTGEDLQRIGEIMQKSGFTG